MNVESLAAVVNALNEADAVYVVAGGVAVIAHGHMRTTADLDLVIALNAENCLKAMTALSSLGYRPRAPVKATDFADEQLRTDWVRDKGMIVFQLVSDVHPSCPVDVFVTEPFDVANEHAQARRFEIQPGTMVPIVRFETLVRLKLAANRPIDIDDIEKLRRLKRMIGEE
jgi:hypothetical protein